MAVKHKKAVKAQGKAKAKLDQALTPKQQTAVSAKKFGVPFWILWGIAGAESTWGEGGSNLFGLLDAAEGANVSNWKSASEQSAKTLAGLKRQYGSWSQAIAHYSGYSYNASHPKTLAAESGVTPANENRVVKRELSHVRTTITTASGEVIPANFLETLESVPGFLGGLAEGGLLEQGPKGKVLGPSGALNENAEKAAGSVGSIIPTPITEAFKDIDAVAKLLVSPQFWIRVAEAIGGMILLYIALKALTGASVPGEGAAKTAAKAAAFKRLPPKQRVT